MGIEEVVIAPRSPWQHPYVERLVGSIRREVSDHIIVLSERYLQRVLTSYLTYYHPWRTHRGRELDAPEPRLIHPPERGHIRGARSNQV